MLFAVVLIFEIVDCKLENVANEGVVVFKVTFRPAELACIAGELDRVVEISIRDGDALLRLLTDGECFVIGEPTEDGEFRRLEVVDGEFRIPGELVTEGDFLIAGDGDALIAGELTRPGKQCLTESEPD